MKKITCMCPTYGRFSFLRDSLSCFMSQTYPNKELIILNDAKIPITCNIENVIVINTQERYETLGHKRQALLELAQSTWVAQWDDDDIYLPWHLEEAVKHLKTGMMVKPNTAFHMKGRKDNLQWAEPMRHTFEAMTAYDREKGLEYGGYTPLVSGQGLQLMKRFKQDNMYREYVPEPSWSFIFRFANGGYHIQCGSHDGFGEKNNDFGDAPLTPNSLKPYKECLIEHGIARKDLETWDG